MNFRSFRSPLVSTLLFAAMFALPALALAGEARVGSAIGPVRFEEPGS